MSHFAIGQRWASETEPELGIGTVLKWDEQTISVLFQANGTVRQYSKESAPIKRVQFKRGDRIKTQDGKSLRISGVSEEKGLLTYFCEHQTVSESELCDTLGVRGPTDRLLSGTFDSLDTFELRQDALRNQYWRRKLPARGFVGGRIDLIPHQLYIAQEVTSRHAPRVLLADEVGLGKTIESCLIVHRMLVTGRASRVLILVPEALIHQWFVELLRRFNLWFHIFDAERCAASETEGEDTNPFTSEQLALCSIAFLAENSKRREQALAEEWDILVVDEAHHLRWSANEGPSPEYLLVEDLGRQASGLILLSATPEQFGLEGHFARLRLLDPDRFHSYDAFRQEFNDYRPVAKIANKLIQGKKLSLKDSGLLSSMFPAEGESIRTRIQSLSSHDSLQREAFINDLIDRHGTGRVMFRNSRSTISGFPKRVLHLAPISEPNGDTDLLDQLAAEFLRDSAPESSLDHECAENLSGDPRITWLAQLLRRHPNEKILLICRTKTKVEAIDRALREKINVNIAQFHEQLALIQRDRNAAWFAEEDGASILLCSEIGSEGRNFQFAHHLVLFDLPRDPEVLEQRIGRLDRIGQTEDVQIHVPYVPGSAPEVMVRWFHEGLNAFEKSLHSGRELFEQFGPRVQDIALDYHETHDQGALDTLLKETTETRLDLEKQLEGGRDRLLELNSYRPLIGLPLAQEIAAIDSDKRLETFMLQVFDHYGIHLEEIASRTYRIGSHGVFADTFPSLPADGLCATFDRRRALGREDITFLSWDHPIVTGAFDLILGAERGNSVSAWWPETASRSILIEAVYLLECVAPSTLHAERFLPPTPVRVVVDQLSNDRTSEFAPDLLSRHLRSNPASRILDLPGVQDVLLPEMIEKTHELAANQATVFKTRAANEMKSHMNREVARMEALRLVNKNVRLEEIELASSQVRLLQQHLEDARLRLDAVRLIWKGPRL